MSGKIRKSFGVIGSVVGTALLWLLIGTLVLQALVVCAYPVSIALFSEYIKKHVPDEQVQGHLIYGFAILLGLVILFAALWYFKESEGGYYYQ